MPKILRFQVIADQTYMAKKPTFLIIGNLKSASTSLAKYLNFHPEIFVPEFEPRFLSSSVISYPQAGPKDYELEQWIIRNQDEYLELYRNRHERVLGDNSSELFYYSTQVIPFIRQVLGDPLIIVILRNPVKRAHSAYQHLVRDGREALSFPEALDAEPGRINENWEALYYYRTCGLYYDNIVAFRNAFSRVKVIITEELQSDHSQVLNSLFKDLGVEETGSRISAIQFNKSGKVRYQLLRKLLLDEQGPVRKIARRIVRCFLDRQSREKLFNYLLNKNLKPVKIDHSVDKELYQFFKEDILKTSELISRDLMKIWNIPESLD